VSHLPHLVACALVDAVTREMPGALAIAARGFRDTTRIAAGDSRMWQEIFLANKGALVETLGAFRRALTELEALLETGDAGAVEAALARIKAAREALS
jgi:prephenate dehydrogenase